MTQLLTKQLLDIEDRKHKCRQAMVLMEQELYDRQQELNKLHTLSTTLRNDLMKQREKGHYLSLQQPETHDIPYEKEQLSIEYDRTLACSRALSVESLDTDTEVATSTPAKPVKIRSVRTKATPTRPPTKKARTTPTAPLLPPGTKVYVTGASSYKLHLYGIGKGESKIGPISIHSGNGSTYRLKFPPGMFLDEDEFPVEDLEVTQNELTTVSGCPPLEDRLLEELDRVEAVFLVHGGVYLLFYKCSWGCTYSEDVLEVLQEMELEVNDLR